MASVVRRWGWWLAGMALVAAGVVLAVAAGTEPVTQFTVLTYEPATDDRFSIAYSGGVFVAPWQVVGVVVGGLGFLLLAARTAYLLGRRPRPV